MNAILKAYMKLALSFAGILLIVAGGLVYFFFFYTSPAPLPPPTEGPAIPAEDAGLLIEDVTVGKGPEVVADRALILSLVYTGSYDNGTVFQTETGLDYLTLQKDAPLGWNKGLVGMKIGGTRLITILPAYSGRAQFADLFPPERTVIYKITLYSILDVDYGEPLGVPPGTPRVQPEFQGL